MATPPPLKKVKAAKASEVCAHVELPKEAVALLKPDSTPRAYLDALLGARQFQAAIRFLAHALPPREAIWWGSLCAKQVAGKGLPAAETAALKAAVVWVLEPTEENRAATKAPGQAAGLKTPAGALAIAASWTGGTLAPPQPKLPPVVPGPYMPAKAVMGAVLLASTRGTPTPIEESQRTFAELGIAVAEGRVTWPEVKPRSVGKTWGY